MIRWSSSLWSAVCRWREHGLWVKTTIVPCAESGENKILKIFSGKEGIAPHCSRGGRLEGASGLTNGYKEFPTQNSLPSTPHLSISLCLFPYLISALDKVGSFLQRLRETGATTRNNKLASCQLPRKAIFLSWSWFVSQHRGLLRQVTRASSFTAEFSVFSIIHPSPSIPTPSPSVPCSLNS